jgi:hypothetical protein
MSTSPLLAHEERIFNLFSYDQSFLEWKHRNGREKGEAHYRKSLAICRTQTSNAYFPLLCVIYKWLEDGYKDFGLKLARSSLKLEPISLDQFMDEENAWRIHLFQPQGELRQVLSPLPGGYYRFFEYLIQLEPKGSYILLNYGAMPYSLSYSLVHYLTHCYFREFRRLQGPIQSPC